MNLVTFSLGLLIAATAHMVWFNSNFPVHVFQLLHLSPARKFMGFPPADQVRYWLRDDWETWLAIRYGHWPYPFSLSELLTCPVCFSVHVSFWISVIAVLCRVDCGWTVMHTGSHMLWLPVCSAAALKWIPVYTFAWPVLIIKFINA